MSGHLSSYLYLLALPAGVPAEPEPSGAVPERESGGDPLMQLRGGLHRHAPLCQCQQAFPVRPSLHLPQESGETHSATSHH